MKPPSLFLLALDLRLLPPLADPAFDELDSPPDFFEAHTPSFKSELMLNSPLAQRNAPNPPSCREVDVLALSLFEAPEGV